MEEFDEIVDLENFPKWLETKLSQKYEFSLVGLTERFMAFFSLFRIIMETLLGIGELVWLQ